MNEVNNVDPETWVVIVLYQPHLEYSLKLVEICEQLQKKYSNIKFMKSIATKCIENYQDIDCPGLLIYKGGELAHQFIPALSKMGGKKVNLLIVEFVLAAHDITETELEEDPREVLYRMKVDFQKGKKHDRAEDSNDSDGEENDREYMHTHHFSSYKK